MIRLENVRKRFGETEVLRGINLEVKRGQRLVVIGPSGSGKSTLLRVINHLEPIDDGLIYLHDKPVFGRTGNGHLIKAHERDIRAVREKIGMVSQRFNLFPHMSVVDNIMVGPVKVKKVPPGEAFDRARALLKRVGLEQKTFAYPSELSGGQQQRVAIARSLAMDPDAILFDEVTSALDPELVGEVLSVMRDLASQGTTMVIVTHEMKFGRDVADRVIMMDHGQIVEEAAPDQLFTNPQSDRTRMFLRDILDR